MKNTQNGFQFHKKYKGALLLFVGNIPFFKYYFSIHSLRKLKLSETRRGDDLIQKMS